jgi:RND family efflux transporter MFP subunit
MSGPSFTHCEVSDFNLPPIPPRGLARLFGEWVHSDPEKLWAAILVITQGKALGITRGPKRDLQLIWAEADAGFRDSISTHLASQIFERSREPDPTVSHLDAPDRMVCITLPLPKDLRTCALVLEEAAPQLLSQRIALFQAAVGYVLAGSLAERSRHLGQLLTHSSAWVDLSTQFLEERYFESACLRLAEQLQRHLQVQGVAVGSSTFAKKGRLHAMTGMAEVDARGRIAELMKTLFVSMHDQEPDHAESADSDSISPLLKEVRKQLQVPEATLLPLGEVGPERRFHLIILGKTSESGFMQALSQPLSALLTTQYATRLRGPRKWADQLVGEKTTWKKALFWAAAFSALVLLLEPVPSRLRVEGQLEPIQRRMIAAKGSGLLMESSVRPGDVVEKGQLLARLEERELRLREAELMATRERRLKRRDALAGLAEADVAERQIAALELEETERQLDLIRFQLGQLKIQAPIAGVLLSGDLSRRLGSSIEKGDLLFELAPLDTMQVELRIPSREMSGLKVGMPVQLRLDPYPDREWQGEIRHIHGRSLSTDPDNPFLVQVPLSDIGDLPLRPGMQARAVILGETRPRVLHLFQPWIDQARLFFFR